MAVDHMPGCCCGETCDDCCDEDTWFLEVQPDTFSNVRSECGGSSSCLLSECEAINDRVLTLERTDTCEWQYEEDLGCVVMTVTLTMGVSGGGACVFTVTFDFVGAFVSSQTTFQVSLNPPLVCCDEREVAFLSEPAPTINCTCHRITPSTPPLLLSC